jgi:hypothetical protein
VPEDAEPQVRLAPIHPSDDAQQIAEHGIDAWKRNLDTRTMAMDSRATIFLSYIPPLHVE